MARGVSLVIAWLAIGSAIADPPGPSDPGSTLRALHADTDTYVRLVRVVPLQAASVSPQGIYSGLVRQGGSDPRIPEDAPVAGNGARNDIVLFASSLDATRSAAWRLLILDHEYFHARHLARGWRTPLVDFGDAEANRHYYEATAWGYVLERALEGSYGALFPAEIREARAAFTRHFEGIRGFIERHQPAAWAHYRRFMPAVTDPDRSPGAFRALLSDRD